MTSVRHVSLVFMFSLLGISTALADGVTYATFTDQHKYWLEGEAGNWANNSSSYGYIDNNEDSIGTPNFLNGRVGINGNGSLASIQVNYTNGSGIEKAGDLFLDTNSDNFWDYVVKIYNTAAAGAAGNYDLYAVNIDARKNATDSINANNYYLSGKDNTGIWSGYVIRDDSPFAAKEGVLLAANVVGQVGFSGWQTQWGPNSSTFTFDPSFIPGLNGSLLTLAWDPNCANDVLFERVRMPSAVPEPSSLILLGSGMFGLLGYRRRLSNRSKA